MYCKSKWLGVRTMRSDKLNISFLWPELPDYAARCLGALRESAVDLNLDVIATKPKVPIEGMEASFGKPVKWLDDGISVGWRDLALNLPDVLFVGGYATLSFKRLEFEARKAGAKVILMSDNSWVGSLKNFIEPLRHRLIYRWRYDAIMVPGMSGARLARLLGYKQNRIIEGMYGADPILFYSSQPLLERQKKLIFVGQLNRRKDVARLADAFVCCSEEMPGWTLDIYGVGPLLDVLPRHQKITYHGFKQPNKIAAAMREARCFVLPSLQENWGLVVHEATLSGCALILSDRVGARHDLACEDNAIIFEVGNTAALKLALLKMSSWDDERWQIAQSYSLQVGNRFGPYSFTQSVIQLLTEHGYNKS